ncbi:MAG: Gfo/Idh/MocA family oxidoreductase [Flavobacteriaceae bacterium]|jgi:predicted dehydrogenase|nr:Gfo/Idh/MocA family oxidoreductase [Flavobacteriaceae bacterium]MDP4674034.1 Gfo/Idh/MocA family oxidoreductase [Flavobacteriaceae bacterium]MDP4754455.1 Gfo/Idh/MocA family oxidoreductase [Flavobacteriaceae bacterium]MDP4794407.1 Gfo/Idh/MocA family oxidoreductase [Flavobacteriaceae bacterium]MDP4885141.1 Gfo/Idh/MocA family oxidoreductase [Flavobacteriaceae bacterium]
MKKIRLGILGGGGDSLIGVLHRVASFINDNYEITGAVFNPVWEENIGFAEKIGIPTNRIYPDFDTLIAEELKLPADERIQVCSILTPNFLHFPMAKKLLENGFHVICEKPMTNTYEEAKILADLVAATGLHFALTHTYTGYPLVRQLREMVHSGAIGKVQKVDVQYYQGWINPIIHDKDKRSTTWRLDPTKAGISCCMGDIGTHAFNMVEYTTGLRVTSLLADLNYLYADNQMDIDGNVLLRLQGGVKGVLRASQIATGEENGLKISVYGDQGGLTWEQENPNRLLVRSDDGALQVYTPGHSYNSALSLGGTKLPPGHPEGIFDAMANIYLGMARAIRQQNPHVAEFPTVIDGVRGLNFIESTVASHQGGNVWIDLDQQS